MPNTNCSIELWRVLIEGNREMTQTLTNAITQRPVKNKDFPCVSIACEYGEYRAFGHSRKCHKSIRKEFKYVPPLLHGLRQFAEPPFSGIVKGRLLFVGTCAEDFSSNQILENYMAVHNTYPNLKDLVFTLPVRPRTYQCRDFCEVCNTIF